MTARGPDPEELAFLVKSKDIRSFLRKFNGQIDEDFLRDHPNANPMKKLRHSQNRHIIWKLMNPDYQIDEIEIVEDSTRGGIKRTRFFVFFMDKNKEGDDM